MKYISKQWQVRFRDILNSFVLGVLVPSIYTIIDYLTNKPIEFTKQSLSELLAIGLTTFAANLLRKLVEPTKVVEVQKLSDTQPGNIDDGDQQGGGNTNNPPPLGGDPLKPKNP